MYNYPTYMNEKLCTFNNTHSETNQLILNASGLHGMTPDREIFIQSLDIRESAPKLPKRRLQNKVSILPAHTDTNEWIFV